VKVEPVTLVRIHQATRRHIHRRAKLTFFNLQVTTTHVDCEVDSSHCCVLYCAELCIWNINALCESWRATILSHW